VVRLLLEVVELHRDPARGVRQVRDVDRPHQAADAPHDIRHLVAEEGDLLERIGFLCLEQHGGRNRRSLVSHTSEGTKPRGLYRLCLACAVELPAGGPASAPARLGVTSGSSLLSEGVDGPGTLDIPRIVWSTDQYR
jgi:hypothetical protein